MKDEAIRERIHLHSRTWQRLNSAVGRKPLWFKVLFARCPGVMRTYPRADGAISSVYFVRIRAGH